MIEAVDTYLDRHLNAIREAAQRIAVHIRRTPLLVGELEEGAPLLKPECFQVGGAFKARGAFNAVLALAQRRPLAGVLAASSGNHAQAVARAARAVGIRARIVMPEEAVPAKLEATRALGAEVVNQGVGFGNREEVLQRLAEEMGWPVVHSFDDWDVIHGQGTAALELLEDAPALDVVAAPIGGGGLIAGTALAVKALRPWVRVLGVEPEVADDARRSLRERRRVRLAATPPTIADGVRLLSIGERNFEVIVERGLVEDIVTVSEAEITAATVLAWRRLKLALEPTAALPLAAWVAGRLGRGRAALILSGGNFEPAVVARLLRDP
jgi:threonine dehydratase